MALENEYGLHIVGDLLGDKFAQVIVEFAERAGVEWGEWYGSSVPDWRFAIDWLNTNRRSDLSHRWGIKDGNFGLWPVPWE